MLLFQRQNVVTEPELMQVVHSNIKGACKPLVLTGQSMDTPCPPYCWYLYFFCQLQY